MASNDIFKDFPHLIVLNPYIYLFQLSFDIFDLKNGRKINYLKDKKIETALSVSKRTI